MRRVPIAHWLCRIIPAIAAGLAVCLPCAAEARGGGGGGMGGFHGGGFHGGGFAGGGIAIAPRGAVGLSGAALRGTHGFRHGGVPRSREVILVPPRRPAPRFGTIGIPPLSGVAVPPLAGTAVPPFGGVAAPLPVAPGLGVVEIWRRDGGVWHLDSSSPPVTAWRRGQNGRWHPEAED